MLDEFVDRVGHPKYPVLSVSCEESPDWKPYSAMTDREKDETIAELKEQIAAIERRIVESGLMSARLEPALTVTPDSSGLVEPTRSGNEGPWIGQSVELESTVYARANVLPDWRSRLPASVRARAAEALTRPFEFDDQDSEDELWDGDDMEVDERSETVSDVSRLNSSAALVGGDFDLDWVVVDPLITSVIESGCEDQAGVNPWGGSCQDYCEDGVNRFDEFSERQNSYPELPLPGGSPWECPVIGGCRPADVMSSCTPHEEEGLISLEEPAAEIAVDSVSVIFREQDLVLDPGAIDCGTVTKNCGRLTVKIDVCDVVMDGSVTIISKTEQPPPKERNRDLLRAGHSVRPTATEKLMQPGGRPPELRVLNWQRQQQNDVPEPIRTMSRDYAYALVLLVEVQSVQMLGNWSRCILLLAQVSEHVGPSSVERELLVKTRSLLSIRLGGADQCNDCLADVSMSGNWMGDRQEEEDPFECQLVAEPWTGEQIGPCPWVYPQEECNRYLDSRALSSCGPQVRPVEIELLGAGDLDYCTEVVRTRQHKDDSWCGRSHQPTLELMDHAADALYGDRCGCYWIRIHEVSQWNSIITMRDSADFPTCFHFRRTRPRMFWMNRRRRNNRIPHVRARAAGSMLPGDKQWQWIVAVQKPPDRGRESGVRKERWRPRIGCNDGLDWIVCSRLSRE